jgi:hypothetical protein
MTKSGRTAIENKKATAKAKTKDKKTTTINGKRLTAVDCHEIFSKFLAMTNDRTTKKTTAKGNYKQQKR